MSLDDEAVPNASRRRVCAIPGCQGTPRQARVCADHWDAIPEDLQDRLRYAIRTRDPIEWEAALRAAVQAVE